MDLTVISEYLNRYGLLAVFIIVFLEYLGLPGFPAGIIMPAAGIFAAQNKNGFFATLLLSICAGVLASGLLYLLGFCGGSAVLKWFSKRFPRFGTKVNKMTDYVKEKGYKGVLISRLIPAVRTMTSFPAGMLKLNFIKYSAYSVVGITIWNLAFIGAGFIFGEAIFKTFNLV